MKSALKLLVTFGVGCLIGIVLVCAGIVSFTDMTWNELVQKLAKIEALEMVGIFAGSIVCTLVAFILQIVLHEGGHLLFGLLSGYRFRLFPYFQLDADPSIREIPFEAFRHRGDRWTMPDAPA